MRAVVDDLGATDDEVEVVALARHVFGDVVVPAQAVFDARRVAWAAVPGIVFRAVPLGPHEAAVAAPRWPSPHCSRCAPSHRRRDWGVSRCRRRTGHVERSPAR